MQSWKRNRKKQQMHASGAPKDRRHFLTSALLLLATLVVAAFVFPRQLSIFGFSDQPFRLGLDLQGGAHLVYEADMIQIPADERDDALEGVKDVIERRVNAFGVSEPLVQTTTSGAKYRVIVELAGVLDISEAIAQIG